MPGTYSIWQSAFWNTEAQVTEVITKLKEFHQKKKKACPKWVEEVSEGQKVTSRFAKHHKTNLCKSCMFSLLKWKKKSFQVLVP